MCKQFVYTEFVLSFLQKLPIKSVVEKGQPFHSFVKNVKAMYI